MLFISLICITLTTLSGYATYDTHKGALIVLVINYIIIFLINGFFYSIFKESETKNAKKHPIENEKTLTNPQKIAKNEFINSTIITGIIFSAVIFICMNLLEII